MPTHVLQDGVRWADIMDTSDPSVIKRLGRQVSPYRDDAWASVRFEIVLRANLLKFGTCADLRPLLQNTGDKVMVEASPYDRIWGIGLAASDPRARDPPRWRGLNLLGRVLMIVRHALRQSSLSRGACRACACAAFVPHVGDSYALWPCSNCSCKAIAHVAWQAPDLDVPLQPSHFTFCAARSCIGLVPARGDTCALCCPSSCSVQEGSAGSQEQPSADPVVVASRGVDDGAARPEEKLAE